MIEVTIEARPLTVDEIRELVAEVENAPTADRWLSYAMQMPKYRRVLATLQEMVEQIEDMGGAWIPGPHLPPYEG